MSRIWTVRTGHFGQDSRDRTIMAGQQDRTARAEQARQNNRDRIAGDRSVSLSSWSDRSAEAG